VRWAILDTNVYVGNWERGDFDQALETVRRLFIIRHSAVVLSELRRGARSRTAERLVTDLCRLATVPWEPTAKDWWEAGRLIRAVGDAERWDRSKRRDFQNDALIALTARRHAATVVTADREDFRLLSREVHVSLFPV
jgi:predicted nucleic acid-binding protein